MRIAVFPGSFDPITKGHESIVNRSSDLFDKIYVAIGVNQSKKYLFDLEKRMEFIRKTFEGNDKVEVITFNKLTVRLCEELGARYILRGLRNTGDFNYEYSISQANRVQNPNIETVFLATEPQYSGVSSSIVRDVYKHGGDIKAFVPDGLEF